MVWEAMTLRLSRVLFKSYPQVWHRYSPHVEQENFTIVAELNHLTSLAEGQYSVQLQVSVLIVRPYLFLPDYKLSTARTLTWSSLSERCDLPSPTIQVPNDNRDALCRGLDIEEKDRVDGCPDASDVDLHPLESKFGGMTQLHGHTHVKIGASFDKCWVRLQRRWQPGIRVANYSYQNFCSSATVRRQCWQNSIHTSVEGGGQRCLDHAREEVVERQLECTILFTWHC